MMVEGDADIDMWTSEAIVAELMDNPNVSLTTAPSERWVMRLIPNLAAYGSTDPVENPHPVLSDVSVRQAIRMAIDVETISTEIFAGVSRPVWTELYRAPYVCDIPQPEFDPDGARALLEAAGWTDEDEDGVRECHGCTTGAEEGYPMSIEFAIYDYGEELDLAQQLMAEQLADIGIETELVMIEGAVMWAYAEDGGTEASGNFDLDVWDDGYAGIDPTEWLWYFYHTDADPAEGGWNVGRWSNADFDELSDWTWDLDEESRLELFCEIAELLDEELPQIMLWSATDTHTLSLRIQNVQATANDAFTWNAADWEVTE
jgi:peptide/nickel transport system substrate-binding protein